jgi:hypothetical protein
LLGKRQFDEMDGKEEGRVRDAQDVGDVDSLFDTCMLGSCGRHSSTTPNDWGSAVTLQKK